MPGIFVDAGDGHLLSMSASQYTSEAELQQLLEDNPELLLGEEPTVGGEQLKYLLVRREAGVPDGFEGDRWSLDHLFVDNFGVPTLVEVKRAGDNRARREVVAQMLDYAANISGFWPTERMREEFESRCYEKGVDPKDEFAAFVETEYDTYWTSVKTNLAAKRLRLVFLNEEVSRPLQTIVEYLNEQMSNTEVLAVEVRRHEGAGVTTFVSRTVGDTSKAQQVKSGGAGRAPWTRDDFQAVFSPYGAGGKAAMQLLDWALAHASKVSWGVGQDPNVSIWFRVEGQDTPVLTFSLLGAGPQVGVQFGYIVNRDISEARMWALTSALRQVPGGTEALAGLEEDEFQKWPRFLAAEYLVPPRRDAWTKAIADFVGIAPPNLLE